MTKVTLTDIASFQNDSTAATAYHNNNVATTAAVENTLSRDGTSPNQMGAPLDMNSFRIVNLPAPGSANEPVRFQDLSTLQAGGTVVTLPVGGTTGQVLQKHSNTNYDVQWSGGVVSSVGLSLPADFTVTGSPVTTAGTLTATLANTPTGTGGFVRATSPTLTGTVTINGSIVDTGGNITSPTIKLAGATSGNTTLQAVATASGTVTVPSVTDTVVCRATTDTLTNKTLTAPVISTISNTGTLTLPTSTDTLVGRATTDTLTNKTIDTAGTNTLKVNGNPLTATAGTATLTLPNQTATILSTAGAAFTGSGGNPTGTTSTSGVMMGMGSTLKFTPQFSGRAMISLQGTLGASGGSGPFLNLRYGTGAAPANGAAPSGTSASSATASGVTAGSQYPFNCSAVITGLSPGTQYWFDASLLTLTAANTATIQNITGIALEV